MLCNIGGHAMYALNRIHPHAPRVTGTTPPIPCDAPAVFPKTEVLKTEVLKTDLLKIEPLNPSCRRSRSYKSNRLQIRDRQAVDISN